VVAGCGTSGPKRLSKQAYAQRADAICTRFNQHAPSSGTASVTAHQVADLARRTLPLLDKTITELRALTLPKHEEQLARRWLASLDRLRTDVVKIRDRARANDLSGVGAVERLATQDDHRSSRLAAQLGMQVCGKPS